MDRIWIVVAILAGSLYAVVVYRDLFDRRIPNAVSVLLVILAVFRWCVVGDFSGLAGAAVFSAVFFAVSVLLFMRGWLGGGDVKLMTSSLLLVGAPDALPFLLTMMVLGGVLALAILARGLISSEWSGHGRSVPYGVAIAASALWVLIADHSASLL